MNKDVRALRDALGKVSVHCMEFSNDNHFDEQCQNLLLWLHLTNWKTMIVWYSTKINIARCTGVYNHQLV